MAPETFNEDFLRRVFAALPAGMVVLDRELVMIGVTDAYLRQTMTRREDIIGHYAFEAFPDNPDDDDPSSMNAMRTSYLRVLDTGKADSMALQQYDLPRRDDPDGPFETRYWSVVNSPVLNDDDAVIGIIHRADDVTEVVEQSAIEGEVPTSVSFLRSSAILQRSAEIEEANRLLRLADSAKNDFLSRMSHELRTPMNAIIGFAQLMELGDLSDEEKDNADQILKAGRHLLTLINDVLDLSGIESGRVRLSLEPVELREAMIDVVDLLSASARSRSITLSTDNVPSILVRADKHRLKQVLLNLVSNAIKYNRVGGRVSFIVREGPTQISIGVSDEGPGISPQHRARLFTPFDRLGVDATEIEGMGLGLALSRTLAEAMGGTIGLETKVAEGSTFWLELDRADKQFVPVSASGADAEAPDYVDTSGILLYIEDNLANTKLMERVIAQFSSLRLITALQGSMGLELAESQRPGLILLDLNLPDIAGEVVLARLKAEPSTRDIPVIIVSADASPRQAERLKEKGAAAYVTKPFDIGELMELITINFAAGVFSSD